MEPTEPDQPKAPGTTRTVKVGVLARVEGEGALHIRFKGDRVEQVQLRIFEPPRFFEALLRGRDHTEAPDITSRICGICPIAYQLGAAQAMEDALGIVVDGPLRELRRLIYCGEWIESQILHAGMLHAPDFLGYDDAIAMAKDHPDTVRRVLALKKLGNQIVHTIGGREIHPVNIRVGGFWRVPNKSELAPLREALLHGRDQAVELVRWAGTLDYPDFERPVDAVCLNDGDRYPIDRGRIVASDGLDIPVGRFEEFFDEEQVPWSNALHGFRKGKGAYRVGPLARWNTHHAVIAPIAREAARDAGLDGPTHNPFRSLIVRAAEALHAFDEAIAIIEHYTEPDAPRIPAPVRAGTGAACTEAPRGICWHRYTIDDNGKIVDARIIPPTSQNQRTIEDDLRALLPGILHLPDDQLTWKCEQAVRNYDPCISCATHFLKLNLRKE